MRNEEDQSNGLSKDVFVAPRDNPIQASHLSPGDNSVRYFCKKKDVPSINNQGRGAEIKWKHLSFRSEHEVAIAETFDALGAMFFPNAAVRLSDGEERVTREVDFLVCRNGRWGILEVDGQQHRHSVAEDRSRDNAFNDHGIWFIRRYTAEICKSKPVYVANDFIKRLDAFYAHLSQFR